MANTSFVDGEEPTEIFDYRKYCLVHKKRSFDDNNVNQTTKFLQISEGFKGIPETLIMSLIITIVIVTLFSFLRKMCWNYGRLALLHRKKALVSKQLSGYDLFQRIVVDLSDSDSEEDNRQKIRKGITNSDKTPTLDTVQSSKENVVSSGGIKVDNNTKGLVNVEKSAKSAMKAILNNTANSNVSVTASANSEKSKKSTGNSKKSKKSEKSKDKSKGRRSKVLISDKGWFSWIPLLLNLDDKELKKKCGDQAILYSKFQRTIIIYLAVVTFISLCVLLTINLTSEGGLVTPGDHYGATTINNINPNSHVFWVHGCLLFAYFFLCIFLLRRFAKNLPTDKEEQVLPSIMVSGLKPEHAGNNQIIKNYFQEAYPKFKIKTVDFAYDAKDYIANQVELKNALSALVAIRNANADHMIGTIKASDYYQEEVRKYKLLMIESKKIAKSRPLPICFVTFSKKSQAFYVEKSFQMFRLRCCSCRKPKFQVPKTKLDDTLIPSKWLVRMAPDPCDIYWKNLASSHWFLKAALYNCVIFGFLFFITTPSTFTTLQYTYMKVETPVNGTTNLKSPYSPIKDYLTNFVSVLVLFTFTVLLPLLVYWNEKISRHWTRSAENLTLLRKSTVFLWFMVLILPSIGLTSFFHIILGIEDVQVKWKCIFIADTGAFYVNYVITFAFLCVPLELLQPVALLFFLVKMLRSKSKFEKYRTVMTNVVSFQYGDSYSWMLLIFAITMSFSLFVPLITAAGLFYFILKYQVDRYSMYFAFKPGKITKAQHLSAMNFVIWSFILAQSVLCLFFWYRSVHAISWLGLFANGVLICMIIFQMWNLTLGWAWSPAKPDVSDTDSQGHASHESLP